MARGTWGGVAEPHPLDVKISWVRGTSREQTGFTLRDTTLTPANPQTAAAHVADWVTTDFRKLLALDTALDGVDVVDRVTKEGGAISFGAVNGLRSVGFSHLPGFVAAVISMKGELRSRYGQGRMFWPVAHESDTENDVLSTAGRAAMAEVIDSFASRYVGTGILGNYRAINAHGALLATRPHVGPTPLAAVPASWYDVTTLRLNAVVTALRSRKAGQGS